MSTASKITSSNCSIHTLLRFAEHQHCDYEEGSDTVTFKFKDGSALMFLFNIYRFPIEVLAVEK